MMIVAEPQPATPEDALVGSAPWLDLAEAEARLTEAQRWGDVDAAIAAAAAIQAHRSRAAAQFAEWMRLALDDDATAPIVLALINRLPLIDLPAREHAASLAAVVEQLAGVVRELRDDVRDLKRENGQLASALVDATEGQPRA